MAESEEALQLKRRARRRLVGAIALVTFVVIILPLILDKEPGPAGPPLSVQIPAQDSGGFNPRVLPPAPAENPAAPATGKKVETAAVKTEPPAAKPVPPPLKEEPTQAPQAAPSGLEAARAKAVLNDQEWVVSMEAFSDKKNVTQLRNKLTAAGVKSYTEAVKSGKGELTRVRAGPFSSKEAAEKARAKLVALGMKPGAVVSR